MHLLTSLIIFSGFVFVFCFGLIKVIWDLSEMSVHVSPHIPPMLNSTTSQPELSKTE
jgi:hypothetical protein